MKRPRPATVVAMIALIIALSGTAYAALSRNSVGSRQLKSGAVTASKIADNAVNGAKIANGSLTTKDINLSDLGTVPAAAHVHTAGDVATVGRHAASCPQGTTLVHGICFDSSSSGPVVGVAAAADECAKRGGWLPSPQELYAARGVLSLGDGVGSHSQFTDSYAYDTNGVEPTTTVVNATGEKSVLNENSKTKEIVAIYEYTCIYPLVR